MNYLPPEQLQKLPTPRLMAYKAKLLKVPAYVCDCGDSSCFELINTDGKLQHSKSAPEWQKVYKDVKDILKTREHIPREKKA